MDERGYLDITAERFWSVPVPEQWVAAFGPVYETFDEGGEGEPVERTGLSIGEYNEAVGSPGGAVRTYNDGTEDRVIMPIPWDRTVFPAGERLAGIQAMKASMDAAFQAFGSSWVESYKSPQEVRDTLALYAPPTSEGI